MASDLGALPDADSGVVDDAPEKPGVPTTLAEAAVQRAAAAERRRRSIAEFEAILSGTTDPEARLRIQKSIEQLRTGYLTEDYNYHVAVYNHAVSLANRRKYSEALALLEKSLPAIKNADLARDTRALIDRLKKDAARFGTPKS